MYTLLYIYMYIYVLFLSSLTFTCVNNKQHKTDTKWFGLLYMDLGMWVFLYDRWHMFKLMTVCGLKAQVHIHIHAINSSKWQLWPPPPVHIQTPHWTGDWLHQRAVAAASASWHRTPLSSKTLFHSLFCKKKRRKKREKGNLTSLFKCKHGQIKSYN